jgi:threonine aldolase
MADAEVGDDVYGGDPTVRALEELGAELSGKEAALFVPSGTFGNQLALFTWCPRGSEVLLGEDCHIIQHEAGAASIIAGVQTRPIPDPGGILAVPDLAARRRKRDLHAPATSLICEENAHSLGRAAPLSAMDAVRDFAREKNLPVHLDGARLFNAAAALGCSARDIAARADSVMFCLSKGLCAPAGSLLAGPADFIEEARLKRKIMGGGMRQTGILAAAGIIALNSHTSLLEADHRRARRLEEALLKEDLLEEALLEEALAGLDLPAGTAGIEGTSVERGDINMVFFSVERGRFASAQAAAELFRERGILINPPDAETFPPFRWKFRFVTHYWIGDTELETIIAASRAIFSGGALGNRGS